MLKQDYKEGEMTLSSALALAIKVLNKTMDVSKLSAEKGADLSSSINQTSNLQFKKNVMRLITWLYRPLSFVINIFQLIALQF